MWNKRFRTRKESRPISSVSFSRVNSLRMGALWAITIFRKNPPSISCSDSAEEPRSTKRRHTQPRKRTSTRRGKSSWRCWNTTRYLNFNFNISNDFSDVVIARHNLKMYAGRRKREDHAVAPRVPALRSWCVPRAALRPSLLWQVRHHICLRSADRRCRCRHKVTALKPQRSLLFNNCRVHVLSRLNLLICESQ